MAAKALLQNRVNILQNEDSPSRPTFFHKVRLLHPGPTTHHTTQLENLFHAGLEPDSFTYANIGSEGGKLTLPDWGVSLLVPRGALEPGYVEEVHM